jgi:hypothetical protein
MIAGCALSGCGKDDAGDIERMVTQLRSSYLKRDYRAVCSHLTRRTQREIGLIGHLSPTTCEKDMVLRLSSDVLSRRDLIEPPLHGLDVDGSQATAQATVGAAEPIAVRFAREEGAWKLASLFGAITREAPVRQPRVPGGASAPTASWLHGDDTTTPCPALKVRRLSVEGGCTFYALAITTMTMLNVLGDRRYGRCPIGFELHVGPDGSVGIGSVQAQLSPDPADICGDVSACRQDDGRTVPWTGRLERGRATKLELSVPYLCLDTCLGRFAGDFVLDVARGRHGRATLTAREMNLGQSGIFLSGRWRLQPNVPGGGLAVH